MLVCKDGLRIAATAHYLPEEVITNEELIKRTGIKASADWIYERTGIKERRWAPPEMATSDLVVPVVKKLCEDAGVKPNDLSRIIVATTSPDHPTPSTACIAHGKLGCEKWYPCVDTAASCTGFLYALDIGARCVMTGEENVVVVAAEMRSRYLNMKDRSTVVLFGDGAGGVLLRKGEPDKGLLSIGTFAEGAGAKSVYVPAGGSAKPASKETIENGEHGLLMADGAQVFVAAVEGMQTSTKMVLDSLSLKAADLDLVIPHQANGNMLAEVEKGFGFGAGKVMNAIENMGNTSSSAVAICLDMAIREGRVKANDLIGLVAVGGGHTAGAAVIRWE